MKSENLGVVPWSVLACAERLCRSVVESEELNVDWRVLTQMETKAFVEGLEGSWYCTSSSVQCSLGVVVPGLSNNLQLSKENRTLGQFTGALGNIEASTPPF